MKFPGLSLPTLLIETLAVSVAYLAAFFLTFGLVMPIQDSFFPEFSSHAILLYLPNGVRVLAAWLLGWRSILALLPGIVIVFIIIGGVNIFQPSRMAAIVAAVTVGPAVFYTLGKFGWDVSPRADRVPCWPCVLSAGIIISLLSAVLMNLALGSPPTDYVAFLIGDIFGMFFLMMILMYVFRSIRLRNS